MSHLCPKEDMNHAGQPHHMPVYPFFHHDDDDDDDDFHDNKTRILISILSTFRTTSLLPLTRISHQFYSLILRILHHRLLETAQLKDHTLILECFHPSTKLSTPYLFCSYIGTNALSTSPSAPDISEDHETLGSLAELKTLYSYFLPLKPTTDRSILRPHPAGGSFSLPNGLVDSPDSDFVCQNIHLESHELFSQLQTITSLVKVGPKRGLFLSSVNIGDSILRIWREWLGVRAVADKGEGGAGEVLWADNNQIVGLRLRVMERDREGETPVLVREGEDLPVSYTLQFEELVIKTTQLLLLVEQSIDQEVKHSGKAVVIGSWDR
ncbi:uncharacterized protein RCO7_07676 [Rhynchosporium graminicola]|uniref:F-box domain protein n=1 Tax=Rhynchosporium graminicola TaxID=2792576 RepID=A0A1E1LPX6_9HELO|nr:uncharacterized protein RCO7_07676 [Rhynchosporium commune]